MLQPVLCCRAAPDQKVGTQGRRLRPYSREVRETHTCSAGMALAQQTRCACSRAALLCAEAAAWLGLFNRRVPLAPGLQKRQGFSLIGFLKTPYVSTRFEMGVCCHAAAMLPAAGGACLLRGEHFHMSLQSASSATLLCRSHPSGSLHRAANLLCHPPTLCRAWRRHALLRPPPALPTRRGHLP